MYKMSYNLITYRITDVEALHLFIIWIYSSVYLLNRFLTQLCSTVFGYKSNGGEK